MEKPEDIDDFVCFVATDSESDEDENHVNRNQTNVHRVHRKRKNIHSDILLDEGVFAPIGLTDNGNYWFLFLNSLCMLY